MRLLKVAAPKCTESQSPFIINSFLLDQHAYIDLGGLQISSGYYLCYDCLQLNDSEASIHLYMSLYLIFPLLEIVILNVRGTN